MNNISKTIKYADKSLNPYPGCWGPGGTREKPNWCSYCYARRIAERFRGTKAWPNGFDPTPHFDRLKELGRASRPYRVFMGDSSDLFGDWVTSGDIRFILRATQLYSTRRRHTYLFLTKNPQRLAEFNPWPSNCWVGATGTDATMFWQAQFALAKVIAPVKFISAEPLLGSLNIAEFNPACVNWVILGGLTGPGGSKSYPKPEWVAEIEAAADKAGIPVWEKENLRASGPYRQEWPK